MSKNHNFRYEDDWDADDYNDRSDRKRRERDRRIARKNTRVSNWDKPNDYDDDDY